jgi:hypothetical protein
MSRIALAAALAAGVVGSVSMLPAAPALAQDVNVRVGPGGVHVGPRHCRTVRVVEWRHGRKIVKTYQRCGRGRYDD